MDGARTVRAAAPCSHNTRGVVPTTLAGIDFDAPFFGWDRCWVYLLTYYMRDLVGNAASAGLFFVVRILVSWRSPLIRRYLGEFGLIRDQSFLGLRLSHNSVW